MLGDLGPAFYSQWLQLSGGLGRTLVGVKRRWKRGREAGAMVQAAEGTVGRGGQWQRGEGQNLHVLVFRSVLEMSTCLAKRQE